MSSRVDLRLRGVGKQHHHDVRLRHGVGRCRGRASPASSAFARHDDPGRRPTRTSCPESFRFSACAWPWRPEPEDRDLLPRQRGCVRVLLVVDRRHVVSSPLSLSTDPSLGYTPPPSTPTSSAPAAFATRRPPFSRMPRSPRASAIRPVRESSTIPKSASSSQQRLELVRLAGRLDREGRLRDVDDAHAEHLGDLQDPRAARRPRPAPSRASARARRPTRARARGS